MPHGVHTVLSCFLGFGGFLVACWDFLSAGPKVWSGTPPSAVLWGQNLSFKVDSLINSSINEKAFPGGQVYVKIGDEIVINKSFGYHTYDSIVKVENDHVYDLASLTKVLASTLSIMKISEDYNLDLNEPVSNYITDLKKSNKINTTFVDVLSHTGGWIPYINHHYLLKRKNGKLKKSILRNKKSKRFNIKVSEDLFLRESYHKKIFKSIRKSRMETI